MNRLLTYFVFRAESSMGHFLSAATLLALLHSIAFMKSTIGIYTLLPHQTIYVGQTLVSQNRVFELGFFNPGKSTKLFLGIWYKSTPDVVLWVANRNNPITHSNGVIFTVSRNGTLAISRGGTIIWSADSSDVGSNPVLQLLDTGNLVVVDNTTQSYRTWQSFNYPTDTWIPGMKISDRIGAGLQSWRNLDDPSPGDYSLMIENRGLAQIVLYRGEMKTMRTGTWNGVYFCGLLPFPNSVFKPNMVFDKERLISIAEPYDSSITTRAKLDNTGLLLRYNMNARKDKWNLAFADPQELCDTYSLCGPNGICKSYAQTRCQCLKGFTPKSPDDWDLLDWSRGCRRSTPLNCSGDGFLELRGVKFPDMLQFWLNISMSLNKCRDECLRNCSCTAYANPYITNGSSVCLMWFGDLVDIKELSTQDGKHKMYIRIPVSELDSSAILTEEKKETPTRIILISTLSGALVSSLINGCIRFMTGQKRRAAERGIEDLELASFKFATIVVATNNFSRENLIGEGGFGYVYKGNLSAEEEIAIKRLSRSSGQGVEEFKNEVMLIAKLQHTNLVKILGCCIEGEERMLIYEYLQHKSLDLFVFDQNRRRTLTWPKRFHIIMGICRGLLYLHHDSRLKIIHRDLKTSNILLDGNLNPKISDFGIARTFGEDQPATRTRRIVGTYGYMAPEYAISGNFSVKSDVFSLGVVLLEIVSGKKNTSFGRNEYSQCLLGHAWLLWKEDRVVELMDECLNDTFNESEVKRCVHVGLLCVQNFAEDRPVMSSVIFMLASDGPLLPEPKEPGFFVAEPVRNCTLSSTTSERTLTITDLEAR